MNEKQLIQLSEDEQCSLRFYTGNLSGSRWITSNGKSENVEALEYFLSCFNYPI